MPDFPIDIICHVVDSVADLIAAADLHDELSNISLVSPNWHRCTRHKLFNNIKYTFNRPSTPRSVSEEGTAYKTLTTLVEFFRTHEHCADAVSSLTLHTHPVQPQQAEDATVDGLPSPSPSTWRTIRNYKHEDRVDPSLLVELLELLPNLEELELRHIVPSHSLPSHRLINHPRLRALTLSLDRDGDAVHSENTLMVLQCFEKIPVLFLSTHIGPPPSDQCNWVPHSSLPESLTLSIGHLSLKGSWYILPSVFEKLAGSPTARTLRVLEFENIIRPLLPNLQILINSVGANLRTLRFSLDFGRGGVTVPDIGDGKSTESRGDWQGTDPPSP